MSSSITLHASVSLELILTLETDSGGPIGLFIFYSMNHYYFYQSDQDGWLLFSVAVEKNSILPNLLFCFCFLTLQNVNGSLKDPHSLGFVLEHNQ